MLKPDFAEPLGVRPARRPPDLPGQGVQRIETQGGQLVEAVDGVLPGQHNLGSGLGTQRRPDSAADLRRNRFSASKSRTGSSPTQRRMMTDKYGVRSASGNSAEAFVNGDPRAMTDGNARSSTIESNRVPTQQMSLYCQLDDHHFGLTQLF
jgi:hypothetical protein